MVLTTFIHPFFAAAAVVVVVVLRTPHGYRGVWSRMSRSHASVFVASVARARRCVDRALGCSSHLGVVRENDPMVIRDSSIW